MKHKKTEQKGYKSERERVLSSMRKPNLSLLGGSITALPKKYWEANMLFLGAPDQDLKELTGDFPRTFRKDKTTHPVFVIEARSTGHRFCPCSSKGYPFEKRYIRKGCSLKMSKEKMDRDCFLVDSCSFTLPLSMQFGKKLRFMGLVPECCIIDERGFRSCRNG